MWEKGVPDSPVLDCRVLGPHERLAAPSGTLVLDLGARAL